MIWGNFFFCLNQSPPRTSRKELPQPQIRTKWRPAQESLRSACTSYKPKTGTERGEGGTRYMLSVSKVPKLLNPSLLPPPCPYTLSYPSSSFPSLHCVEVNVFSLLSLNFLNPPFSLPCLPTLSYPSPPSIAPFLLLDLYKVVPI
jgi:hypothetical protein